jgi:hypothetical protein
MVAAPSSVLPRGGEVIAKAEIKNRSRATNPEGEDVVVWSPTDKCALDQPPRVRFLAVVAVTRQ